DQSGLGEAIRGRSHPRPCDRRDVDYRPPGSHGCTDTVRTWAARIAAMPRYASTQMVVDARRWRRSPIAPSSPRRSDGGGGSCPPLWTAKSILAITLVPQVLALLAITLAVLLLWMCCRSWIRRSSIDSKHDQTLERRLQELREECANASTLRRIA